MLSNVQFKTFYLKKFKFLQQKFIEEINYKHTAQNSIWIIVPPVLAVLFIIILLEYDLNRDVFLYLNSHTPVFAKSFWTNLTLMGDSLFAIVLLLPFIKKRPDFVKTAFLAGIFAFIFSYFLKHYFLVKRPPALFSPVSINIIGYPYTKYSFPSGHSTTIFMISALIIFGLKDFKLQFPVFLSAFLIAISRIMVGVHWPTDVLGGLIIGWISAGLAIKITSRNNVVLPYYLKMIMSLVVFGCSLFFFLFYDSGYPNTFFSQRIVPALFLSLSVSEIYKSNFFERNHEVH